MELVFLSLFVIYVFDVFDFVLDEVVCVVERIDIGVF